MDSMKIKTILGMMILTSSVNVYADDISDIEWTDVTRPSAIFKGTTYQKFLDETPVYVVQHQQLDKPLNASDITYYENVELVLPHRPNVEGDIFTMRQHSSEGEFRQSQVTYLVKPTSLGSQEVVFDASVALFSNKRKAESNSFTINISTSTQGTELPTIVEVVSGAMKCSSLDVKNELSLNCVDIDGKYMGYVEWSDIKQIMDIFHEQEGRVRTFTDWYFEFVGIKVR